MKKALSWFFIVFGVAVMVASTARSLMKRIYDKKDYLVNTSWWGEHISPWGDLVYMSYLDDIAKFHEKGGYNFVRPHDGCNKNIDLYLCGDSYTEYIPDSAFARIHSFHFVRNYSNQQIGYKPDSSKRKILIIETAERYLRDYLESRQIFDKLKKNEIACMPAILPRLHASYSTFGIYSKDIFNPNINQNLEYNLFNYKFLTSIRYLKADLNYYCFNRASGNVAISDNGAYLFIRESVVPSGIYSYSERLSGEKVNQMIAAINDIYLHYKSEGFSEVYLAIIPNPATILQAEYYNQMIPLIQNNPSLQMPVIDLYTVFKNQVDPASLYRAGDTHWNNKGMQIWIGKVNQLLLRQ